MTASTRETVPILVASDDRTDAALVKELLKPEFHNVALSLVAAEAAADFDKHHPDVLVLAFDTLEKSERHYLGLYRQSRTINLQPHRTVVLCKKDEVARAYEMCRSELFDDYMLFWPMTNDTPRLRMSIHLAARELAALRDDTPTARDFARGARELALQEPALERQFVKGGEHIAAASQTIARAGRSVGVAIAGLTERLAHTADGDPARTLETLTVELDRIKHSDLEEPLRLAAESIKPVAQWAGALKESREARRDTVDSLEAMADRLPPIVLVVDDDDFQRKLVARILEGQHYHLIFASNGLNAIGLARKSRPDVILMDIVMPGMSGIETTRLLKMVPQLATVPVIMFTTNSEGNVVAESLSAGASDFVVKPFDPVTLIGKVRKMLQSSCASPKDRPAQAGRPAAPVTA